jgi:hypothetical protein
MMFPIPIFEWVELSGDQTALLIWLVMAFITGFVCYLFFRKDKDKKWRQEALSYSILIGILWMMVVPLYVYVLLVDTPLKWRRDSKKLKEIIDSKNNRVLMKKIKELKNDG